MFFINRIEKCVQITDRGCSKKFYFSLNEMGPLFLSLAGRQEGQTDGRTDGQAGQTGRRMDGRTDRQDKTRQDKARQDRQTEREGGMVKSSVNAAAAAAAC